jgi:hypothetical protein
MRSSSICVHLRNLRNQLSGFLLLMLCLPSGCARQPTAASPPGSPIRFVDVTAEAGIRFRHTHGGFGKKYLPETNGSGVAWLDYDGDGRQDLLFVNCRAMPRDDSRRSDGATGRRGDGATNDQAPSSKLQAPSRQGPGARSQEPGAALYRNRGDGTFEERTAGSGLDVAMYGQGVSAADYDGDGDPDVLITCLGPNHLFRNEGDGRFTDVTDAAGLGGERNPWRYHAGSAWLDFDRDGWLDLFVARYAIWTPKTDPFCGVPGGVKRYCPPWKLPRERCAFYRNLGNGRFRDVSRQVGVDTLAGYWFQPMAIDDNQDGWPDVAVICDGTPMALFRNERGRRFRDVAPEAGIAVSDTGSPKSQMGIDAVDWRNRGQESILVGNFSGERLSLLEPEQPELYSDVADRVGMGASSLYSLTFGVAFLDADRDAWPDAFIANGHIDDYIERFDSKVTYRQPPLFYRNDAGQRFVLTDGGPAMAPKMVARGCAVADYDEDGDVDLVVTENNGPAHLFRNDTPTANRFLRVVLRGEAPNREAIGARVTVVAGGSTGRPPIRQIRWVRAGGHYYSQSELPLTFGVGTASTADVTVTWPGGGTSERKGVVTNATVTVEPAKEGFSDRINRIDRIR